MQWLHMAHWCAQAATEHAAADDVNTLDQEYGVRPVQRSWANYLHTDGALVVCNSDDMLVKRTEQRCATWPMLLRVQVLMVHKHSCRMGNMVNMTEPLETTSNASQQVSRTYHMVDA